MYKRQSGRFPNKSYSCRQLQAEKGLEVGENIDDVLRSRRDLSLYTTQRLHARINTYKQRKNEKNGGGGRKKERQEGKRKQRNVERFPNKYYCRWQIQTGKG